MKTIKFKAVLSLYTIFILIFCFAAITVAAEKKPVKKVPGKEGQKTTGTSQTEQPATPATVSQETSSSPVRTLDPKDPRSLIYLDTKGEKAGTGDIKKSGIASMYAKIGAGWHPTALADTNLPMDKYKLVDWAKVVKEKLIAPSYDLDPSAKPDDEQILDMNILFETKSDFMDNVLFPHLIHTWWVKCETCHASVGGAIFEPIAGGNNVMMIEMADGKWCGRCHNRISFPLADCKRCHIMPKGTKPDESITLRKISK